MLHFNRTIFTYYSDKYILEHHAEINSILNNFTKASYKVSNDLKNFETEFSKIKDENSSEGRIKKIQYANLQQSFQEVMEQNNQLIETYRNYVRDMYKKSARIGKLFSL